MRVHLVPRSLSVLRLTLLLCGGVLAQNLQENDTCRIVTFIPFTDLREGPDEEVADEGVEYYGYGSWPDPETLAKASYSLLAAAELARIHFNDRNPVLVPELADLVGSCSITMPSPLAANVFNNEQSGSVYLDSAYSRSVAVRSLLRLGDDDQAREGGERDNAFCAVVGPVDSFVNQGVSVVTEAVGVPQIAYSTVGYRLSNRDEYPTFFRVIPEAYDFGATIAKLIHRDIWKREVTGVIYEKSDFGEQFESPLEEYRDELKYLTITEAFQQGDDESIREALQVALDNGYLTIVLITDRTAMLDNIARVAGEMGMLGESYFWILSGEALPPAILKSLQYPVDSPPDRMLRGAALFTNFDRFVYHGETDPFLAMWREADGSLVNRFNNMQPGEGKAYYEADETYFQTETPSEYASFMYDAVITAGLSACNTPPHETNETRTLAHINQVPRTVFQGASGPVRFKYEEEANGSIEFQNSREPADIVFGVYNIRPGAVGEDGMRSYESVLTHLYSNENQFVHEETGETEQGAWEAVEGTDFLFFDGTTDEPMPRRVTFNSHFLSSGVQISGIFLSSFALLLAVLSGLWVFLYRGIKLVKASQPEFLYLLCFGAASVALSPIFMSFDEDKGVSDDRLTAMCQAFPFFFVIGYLSMYCALFSKLWRLSRLLQLRRQAVQIKQVIWPIVGIGTASIVVLILWQTLEPLQWERNVISIGDEPFETYGECSEGGLLPFLIPLALLIALTVGVTAVFAWKMKNVQAELSESRWIFAGIFLHIQTWLVGVPIFYITNGVSRDASYLMLVVLSFTFSTSLVALVIWPKVHVWAREKFYGGPVQAHPHINLSGNPTARISGLQEGPISSCQPQSKRSLGTSKDALTSNSSSEASELRQRNAKLLERVAELQQLSKGPCHGKANSQTETAATPTQHILHDLNPSLDQGKRLEL